MNAHGTNPIITNTINQSTYSLHSAVSSASPTISRTNKLSTAPKEKSLSNDISSLSANCRTTLPVLSVAPSVPFPADGVASESADCSLCSGSPLSVLVVLSNVMRLHTDDAERGGQCEVVGVEHAVFCESTNREPTALPTLPSEACSVDTVNTLSALRTDSLADASCPRTN